MRYVTSKNNARGVSVNETPRAYYIVYIAKIIF